MWLRLLIFFLCLLVGAAAGWFVAGWPGTSAGLLLAALLWSLFDVLRATRIVPASPGTAPRRNASRRPASNPEARATSAARAS